MSAKEEKDAAQEAWHVAQHNLSEAENETYVLQEEMQYVAKFALQYYERNLAIAEAKESAARSIFMDCTRRLEIAVMNLHEHTKINSQL